VKKKMAVVALGLAFLAVTGSVPAFAQAKTAKEFVVDVKDNLEAKFSSIMDFVVSVNRQKIQDTVAGYKKNWPHLKDEDVANDTILNKAVKNGFEGAIFGAAPGPFSIPASMAGSFVSWIRFAEIAFAVACTFGTPPSAADLKTDVWMLLCDASEIKDACRENGITIGETITKSIVKKMTPAQKTKILTSLSKKALGRITINAAKGVTKVPAAGSLVSFFKDTADALAFGNRALKYYRDGKFDIRGQYSAANNLTLIIQKGGSVDVYAYNRDVYLGSGTSSVKDNSLTITFRSLAFPKGRTLDNSDKNVDKYLQTISGQKRVYTIASSTVFTYAKPNESWGYMQEENYKLLTQDIRQPNTKVPYSHLIFKK